MGRIGDWFDGYDRKGWDAYAALQAQRQREREAYVQAMRLRSIEERLSAIEAWTDAPGCICDPKHGMKPACPVHGESGNLAGVKP